MKKIWIGVIALIGISLTGAFFLQMWEQVFGQPVGFSVDAPQVVVNQPAVLPKWCVDFIFLPPQGGKLPEIRVITIVDTETKRIAVYHMELATGKLWLLSVRDIQPDLMLNEFNAISPLPSELSKELQRLEGKNR